MKTETTTTDVTVVIVCFNHARWVEQALDAAFAQTHPEVDVIIMDDASADDSVDRIRTYLERTGATALFIAHEDNRGLCATLNEALTHVSTPYVAFISADDWMEPHRIATQVAAFEHLDPRVAVVHSDMFLVDEGGGRLPLTYQGERQPDRHPEGHGRDGDVFASLVKRCEISTPAALIRRSVLADVGPYDEELNVEDYDMWLRISQRHQFHYLPEPLVNYRIVGDSMYRSLGTYRHQAMQLTVLKKNIGARPELDPILLHRIQQLVLLLYVGGRSAADTAHDLRMVVRRVPSARGWAYLTLATLRMPGRWIASINRARARITGAPPQR